MANIKNKVVAEALGENNTVFKGGTMKNVFVQTPLLVCPSGVDNQQAEAREISPQDSMEQLIANVNKNFPMEKVSAKGIQDMAEKDFGAKGNLF